MIKKILSIILITLLTASFITAVYLYSLYKKIYVATTPSKPAIAVSLTSPTPTPDPLAPYNVLLLGYGGGNHDGAFLTDTIILTHIQPKEKKVTLISIPRDIWLPLPIYENQSKKYKINAAYAIGRDDKNYPNKKNIYSGESGAANLAKYAVEKVTGLSVNYYVSINFQGFKNAINALGGVDVDVPQTFDDYFYPIEGKQTDNCGKSDEEIKNLTATMSGFALEQQFPCRYEHLHFEAGRQHMDGETALKFVRSRHSPTAGGDFNRAMRQQALLVAVVNRVLAISSLPKLPSLIGVLADNVKTDFDLSKLGKLLEIYGNPANYEIKSISLNDENVLSYSTSSDGQYILIPKDGENNWQSIHQYIKDQLQN